MLENKAEGKILNRKLNKKTLYILSFCIPVLMMVVAGFILKVYPFGDNTILYNDSTSQMVSFYSYFRSIILENNDCSYTLSKFMGGDMAGFAGYYLTNPFLLILLLFDSRMMPLGIFVITALHIGAFGLACFHFLDVKSGASEGVLIFSTGYAFMGIVFSYISLSIFFMAFLLAPLVAAGIVKIVRGTGKCYEYIFALAFMVICNFYQGYMTCFFALFYFVYLIVKEGAICNGHFYNVYGKSTGTISNETGSIEQNKEDLPGVDGDKGLVRIIILFVFSSLTAICISAINLIPVVISLSGTKNGIDFSILRPERSFRFVNVFSQFYTNAFNGNLSNEAMPYIYVGFVAFVFLILYFFNQKITSRDRAVTFLGLILFLGCAYISTTDIILHGFNNPEGFSHRYAFLICLFVVDVAYESYLYIFGDVCGREYDGVSDSESDFRFDSKDDIKDAGKESTKDANGRTDRADRRVAFIGVGFLLLIYSMYAYRFATIGLSWWSTLWDVAIAAVVVALAFYADKLRRFIPVITLILIGVQCIDLTENAIWSIPLDEVEKMSDYMAYYDRVLPVIDDIQSQDQSLYRIEKDFEWSHNDSMLFNYNGLSHYSSCEKDYVESFAKKMGFRESNVWTFYNQGSTSFVDSLLGVKYFISRFDSTDKPYASLYSYDETYSYENPYALPFMIPVHSDMSKVDMSSNNLFEIQNELIHEFGINEDLLTAVDIEDIVLTNVREVEYAGFEGNENKFASEEFKVASEGDGTDVKYSEENDTIEETGESGNNKLISDEGDCTVTRYEKINSEDEAYIEYVLRPQVRDNLYLYFDAPHGQYTEIYVNDAYYDNYFTYWRWNILKIGKYHEGTEVRVKLMVNEEGLDISEPYFYTESDEVLKAWYEKVTTEKTELNKISSSHLSGSATLNEDGYLMFTLPKEKGWTIKIDGIKAEYAEVLGALIMVPVEAGDHVIDMKYVPPGRIAGVVITLLTLIILSFSVLYFSFFVNKEI